MIPDAVKDYLKQAIGSTDINIQSVGGGCINETYRIEVKDRPFFCKVNKAALFPQMFKKEKHGLELIAQQNIIRTPKIVDCAIIEDQQILLLEWIYTGTKSTDFWKAFGEQLAGLHQINNDYFGLDEDNYMGSVPQINQQETDWNTFFVSHRLRPLLKSCRNNNLLAPKHQLQFEKVFSRLPEIFPSQKPSLLHGDLWSGNYMCDEKNQPVLIDTAVYYGHPSIDLGMTTLFGGFDRNFYEAYHHYFPLPSNYQEQWEICNLYPLLIHLLLFGKSYLAQIESTLKSYQ